MSVRPVPEGFRTVTPYLLVKGVASLLTFLEKGLGAKVVERHAAPDGTVMHAQIQLGDSRIMMGEVRPPWDAMPGSIYLYVSDTDALYHRALAAGAISVLKPSDQFYGDRNAGVKDISGNVWWISTHIEDVSPEELQRRMANQPNHG